MHAIQVFTAFVGRIFLSAIFLFSGVMKLFGWEKSRQFYIDTLTTLSLSERVATSIQAKIDVMIQYSPLCLALAVLFELIGGFMVFSGYKARLGAFILLFFIVPTTIVFHSFWLFEDPARQAVEMAMFMKNLAIIGGLLLVCAFGTGAHSKKSKSAPAADHGNEKSS